MRDLVVGMVSFAVLSASFSLGGHAAAQAAVPKQGMRAEANAVRAHATPEPPVPAAAATGNQPLATAIQVAEDTGCLKQPAVVGHVRMWLGRRQVSADLRVRLERHPRHKDWLTFSLWRKGHRATRTFRDIPTDCDALHALLGLAIALAIDARALAPVVAPPSAEPAVPPRLSAQASLASELLPGLSLGLHLSGQLNITRWLTAHAGVLAHHSRRNTLRGSQGRFDSTLLAGTAALCSGGDTHGGTGLAVCIGPALGALHVRGHGYAPNDRATGLWLGVLGGLQLDLPLGLPIRLSLSLVSGLVRPKVATVRPDGTLLVRRLSPTGLLISLGPSFEM